MARDYKSEYRNYQGKPEQIKNRDARNAARALEMKKGLVHKGDGKDVNHKVPLSKGGKPGAGNLNIQSAHENRSFNRNADRSIKYRGKK